MAAELCGIYRSGDHEHRAEERNLRKATTAYTDQRGKAGGVGKGKSGDRIMIDKAGRYRVKCGSGKEYDIDVIDKDGTLGVEFRMLDEFTPVAEFVNVKILKGE